MLHSIYYSSILPLPIPKNYQKECSLSNSGPGRYNQIYCKPVTIAKQEQKNIWSFQIPNQTECPRLKFIEVFLILTLLVPSYFGPTLYTPPLLSHQPLVVQTSNLVPFKVSEN